MSFNIYFAGAPFETEVGKDIRNTNRCVLLSQLNDRSTIYKWINELKTNPNAHCKMFIDSGAFSAWTKGKQIDVDEYIDFINKHSEYLEVCASVDKIPGEARTTNVASEKDVEEAAKATWENFLYMRSKVNDKDKLLYTFHVGEPWYMLEQALNYKDAYGKIAYIALGGLVGKNKDIQKAFIERCFEMIKNSPNPNVKVHGFGLTRLGYLEQYPFTSADSTAWLMTGINGGIFSKWGTLKVSERSIYNNDHVCNKLEAGQEEIKKYIESKGFTLDELMTVDLKRQEWNYKYLCEWADNYKYTPNIGKNKKLF
ncbi:hypothetical protein [uncultured Clostridium sp.]|uniref:hypothetical protein n=1 Tax=uncultured Clostridium sp. TaxID=59620 RepID=UPI002634A679|nr:hypothetical protein [uncultured Clostridium sp.]